MEYASNNVSILLLACLYVCLCECHPLHLASLLLVIGRVGLSQKCGTPPFLSRHNLGGDKDGLVAVL
jgi:hypothetical protein